MTTWVNLAARRLAASVVAASDEFFGEKENLLRPVPAVHQPHTFGHKGQTVDGWETRRRHGRPHPAGGGSDFAVVRLGCAGVIHQITVDTAHFTGNYPEECSVQACAAEGYPGPDELTGAGTQWAEIVPRSALGGDRENRFTVDDGRRYSHVRLNIYPDGGVARLRVHGEVVPDPRLLDGLPLDLAAEENGGTVADVSDRFYSSPENLIAPGRAAVMGDGWETRRRRDSGNDWVLFRLAASGHVRQAVVDTSYFLGNAPAACRLRACDATQGGLGPDGWFDLLPRTPVQPDTRHRFRIAPEAAARRATHVRLDVYPDGGLARLRLFGNLDAAGRAALGLRWFNALPTGNAVTVLTSECGLAAPAAAELVDRRPFEQATGPETLLPGGTVSGLGPAAAQRLRVLILGR